MSDTHKSNPDSGFIVSNLLMLESSFKRESTVTFEPEKVERHINIDVKTQVDGNKVAVIETVHYLQKKGEVNEVEANIQMVGVFEKIGESNIVDLEQFGEINGASIIFPYIREHLSNLSLKAGIGLILLPPANFTRKTT